MVFVMKLYMVTIYAMEKKASLFLHGGMSAWVCSKAPSSQRRDPRSLAGLDRGRELVVLGVHWIT